MVDFSKRWHRDYAAESIKRHERSQWYKDPDFIWTRYAVSCCGEVGQRANRISDELRKSGITLKKHEPVVLLLEKYGSARGIAKAIWNLTDEEIDNADIDT